MEGQENNNSGEQKMFTTESNNGLYTMIDTVEIKHI